MAAISDANDLLGLLTSSALTLDSLSNLLTDGGAVASEMIYAHKDARFQGAASTAPAAGTWTSLWQSDGTPLPGAAAPTSWANPVNTTAGALMQANPGGARTKYLLSLIANAQNAGMLVLYDRLAHCGGLNATLTTAQNVNGGVLGGITRNTGGVNNQIWYEIYAAIGSTATTITASYQDGAGATQTTQPVAIGGTNRTNAQLMFPMSLTPGGSTVKGVTSVTLAASTLTAGNFGITIARPLAYALFSANLSSAFTFSFLTGNVPTIDTNASLAMMFLAGAASLVTPDVFLTAAEK